MSAAAPRVGFLGLGIMGAQMASRLVGTGQNVMVYNRSVAKAEPLRQLGAAGQPLPKAPRLRTPRQKTGYASALLTILPASAFRI